MDAPPKSVPDVGLITEEEVAADLPPEPERRVLLDRCLIRPLRPPAAPAIVQSRAPRRRRHRRRHHRRLYDANLIDPEDLLLASDEEDAEKLAKKACRK